MQVAWTTWFMWTSDASYLVLLHFTIYKNAGTIAKTTKKIVYTAKMTCEEKRAHATKVKSTCLNWSTHTKTHTHSQTHLLTESISVWFQIDHPIVWTTNKLILVFWSMCMQRPTFQWRGKAKHRSVTKWQKSKIQTTKQTNTHTESEYWKRHSHFFFHVGRSLFHYTPVDEPKPVDEKRLCNAVSKATYTKTNGNNFKRILL